MLINDFVTALKNTILSITPAASFVKITMFKELVPGKDMTKKSRANQQPLNYTVFKMSTIYGGCGNEYEQAVNNRLTKEGKIPDFTKQERTWGTRVGNSPIIEHKGKFYFEYNNSNHNWAKNKSMYYTIVNNQLVPLSISQIKNLKRNFLDKPYTPKNQGTDKPVIINTVAIENIIEFSGFGFQMNRKIKM